VSKRIAHVTTAHPVTDNRIFRKECMALVEAGFEVHLVAVASSLVDLANVALSRLPRRATRISRMFFGPIDAWKALRRLKPDLIHVHDPELIPMALLWRLICRTPVIFDAHEDLPKQVAGKPYLAPMLRALVASFARLLELAADRGMNGIVVATPAIARNFRNPHCALVQNFPWLHDFPSSEPPATVGDATICYVGGISEARGGMEMIQAIKRSRSRPVLVAAGPATPSMRDALARESDYVSYLGVLSAERIPKVVIDSRAGIVLYHPLPNHMECQPTKIFEYMAAGRPFIASDFPRWRDLLGQFHCGIFVDPTNVSAIGAAIDKVVLDERNAAEMGARGRAALVEHFTFEGESQRLIDLSRRLLQTTCTRSGF